jgi:N-acetylglutamate synthase-like GNAT family acetyltransferase
LINNYAWQTGVLTFTPCISGLLPNQQPPVHRRTPAKCVKSNQMIRAAYSDKKRVTDILVQAFDTNKSVNHIVQAGSNRAKSMQALMSYSFDVCYEWGDVFLSDDKSGCALLLFPEKKKTSLHSVARDARLVLNCFGILHAGKVLRRETAIKKLQPKELMYYLWFIGVHPAAQHKGTGSQLLQDVILQSERLSRPLVLETSVTGNVEWYKHFGFKVYQELDLGYQLYFMRREGKKEGLKV